MFKNNKKSKNILFNSEICQTPNFLIFLCAYTWRLCPASANEEIFEFLINFQLSDNYLFLSQTYMSP